MTAKTLSVITVSLAVIAAAVAAVIVTTRRADEARSLAVAASAEADAQTAAARAEEAQKAAETEKRRAAEASEKAKTAELAANKVARETAELEAKAAADRKATAEATAAAERAKADLAIATRETAAAQVAAARVALEETNAVARIESARAEAEATRLATERLKADKVLAEAKVLELRKVDYETLEQNLIDWKLDLEERERALKPEKSIADLSWAGGMEDSVLDEKGNLSKQVKKAYDPEKDMSLPSETRRLSKAVRLSREAMTNRVATVRSAVVRSMEKLYVTALRENRVVDAEFYRKTILSMYPDWKLTAEP